MGAMTTPLDLAHLKALRAQATQGPWEYTGDSIVRPGYTRKGDGLPKRRKDRDVAVIALDNHAACGDPECCQDSPYVHMSAEDAAYIVALVNAAEALIAAAEERDGLRELHLSACAVNGELSDEMHRLIAERDALRAEVTALRETLDVTKMARTEAVEARDALRAKLDCPSLMCPYEERAAAAEAEVARLRKAWDTLDAELSRLANLPMPKNPLAVIDREFNHGWLRGMGRALMLLRESRTAAETRMREDGA